MMHKMVNGKKCYLAEEDEDAVLAERAKNTIEQKRSELVGLATIGLVGSDWRSAKASDTGVPMSKEWLAYRQACRDVLTGDRQDLPPQP